jgi:hypothetical protein
MKPARLPSIVLLIVPGALLVVLGVFGCNVNAMSSLGYGDLIAAGPTLERPVGP